MTAALLYSPVGSGSMGDAIEVVTYTYATHALALVGSISGTNTHLSGHDPLGVAVDESGNIYVSASTGTSAGVVYEYAAGSGSTGIANVAPIRTITTTNSAGELWAAHGLVYVNETTGGGTGPGVTEVFGVGSNSVPTLSITAGGVANSAITGVIADASGNIYVANNGNFQNIYPSNNPTIYVYSSTGTQIATITNGDTETFSMAFDPSGNLFANNYFGPNPPPPFTCCSLSSYAAASLLSNPTASHPLSGQQMGAGSAIAIDTHGDLFGTPSGLYAFAAGYTPGQGPTTTLSGIGGTTFNLAVYPHP